MFPTDVLENVLFQGLPEQREEESKASGEVRPFRGQEEGMGRGLVGGRRSEGSGNLGWDCFLWCIRTSMGKVGFSG